MEDEEVTVEEIADLLRRLGGFTNNPYDPLIVRWVEDKNRLLERIERYEQRRPDVDLR